VLTSSWLGASFQRRRIPETGHVPGTAVEAIAAACAWPAHSSARAPMVALACARWPRSCPPSSLRARSHRPSPEQRPSHSHPRRPSLEQLFSRLAFAHCTLLRAAPAALTHALAQRSSHHHPRRPSPGQPRFRLPFAHRATLRAGPAAQLARPRAQPPQATAFLVCSLRPATAATHGVARSHHGQSWRAAGVQPFPLHFSPLPSLPRPPPLHHLARFGPRCRRGEPPHFPRRGPSVGIGVESRA